jgi:hypothetical protein
MDDPQTGISYLEKYVNSPTVDQVGKNYACEVLAKCYQRIGGVPANETARQYLENLIKSATELVDTHPDQRLVAMNAADRLGRLLGHMGDHNGSIRWHAEAYELAKSLPDLAKIQELQVALGMARATAMMPFVAR